MLSSFGLLSFIGRLCLCFSSSAPSRLDFYLRQALADRGRCEEGVVSVLPCMQFHALVDSAFLCPPWGVRTKALPSSPSASHCIFVLLNEGLLCPRKLILRRLKFLIDLEALLNATNNSIFISKCLCLFIYMARCEELTFATTMLILEVGNLRVGIFFCGAAASGMLPDDQTGTFVEILRFSSGHPSL